MKLRHLNLESELIWNESQQLCELVIKSPTFLREILFDLSDCNHDPKLSLTQHGQAINLSDEADIIFNPFDLNLNNHKVLAALFKKITAMSVSEDFYLSTNKIKTDLLRYLNDVVDSGQFNFEVTDGDFDAGDLAKAVKLHIVDEESDFVGRIISYLSAMTELAGTKIFVFVNLRTVLTTREFTSLQHELQNHQINVLLVESRSFAKLPGVSRVTIDEDLCEL